MGSPASLPAAAVCRRRPFPARPPAGPPPLPTGGRLPPPSEAKLFEHVGIQLESWNRVTHIGIQRWETSSAATDTGEISKKLVILERRRRQTLGRISLVCTRIEGERSLTLQARC